MIRCLEEWIMSGKEENVHGERAAGGRARRKSMGLPQAGQSIFGEPGAEAVVSSCGSIEGWLDSLERSIFADESVVRRFEAKKPK